MQQARDAEEQSPHPTHKVGALLHGINTNAKNFTIAKSNFWPTALETSIGRNTKIGNASTTIHAEISTILSAPTTEDTDIYITDLPCPNCAKAIAEARIKAVYIDAHTHNTLLGKKIEPFFKSTSMPIFKSANISVYELDIENKTLKMLHKAQETTALHIERPVDITPIKPDNINAQTFNHLVKETSAYSTAPFAACIAKTTLGQYRFIAAQAHISVGLSQDATQSIRNAQSKYKPTLEPLNRLLLTCARHGMKIIDEHLYSSQTPTAREFVNIIGAGHTNLNIGNTSISRDEHGLTALEQIKKNKILNINET